MDAYATSRDERNGAPVWKHGPDGELGVGELNWAKLRQLMLVMWLPAAVLMFFSFNWATFLIFCGAIPVSVRLARLEGTPLMVEGATTHWGVLFAVAASGLFGARLLATNVETGLTNMAYALVALAFIYATVIHFDAKKLLNWETVKGKTVVAPETSIADLKAMRDGIESSRVSLASLPVFDDKKPELLKAWEDRNPQLISHLLQGANLQTQESWSRANSIFNRAQFYVDRARVKLNGLLPLMEQRLAPYNLNYQAIEVERSKLGHLEMSAAIPENLTVKRIDAQNTAFIQGGSKAVMDSAFGRLPPLVAVAFVGIVVAAHFIYKTRTLRRLKDAEGQLVINATAVRGDCTTVDSIFTTRLLPQFDGMIDVVARLEVGLADLQADGVDTTSEAQRAKALQMAFALVDGRRLVATAGGN